MMVLLISTRTWTCRNWENLVIRMMCNSKPDGELDHYKLDVRVYLREVFSDCEFAVGHLCRPLHLNGHFNAQILHHVRIQIWRGEGMGLLKYNVTLQRYQTLEEFERKTRLFSNVSLQTYYGKCPEEYAAEL